MTRFRSYFFALLVALCSAQLLSAQSVIDLNVGFGAAQDKASPTGLDSATFQSCSLLQPGCQPTPSLNSFFMGLGANLMLWEHFGVGGEVSFQPGKQRYANLPADPTFGLPASQLQSRVMFYDFNGIYRPLKGEKVALDLIGGIGGVNMRFYQNFTGSSLIGNYNTSQYASSANHFQLHAAVGVQYYLTDNIFVRPQVDFRYVPNFVQFGRNSVTQEMIWIGYTIGERQ